MPTYSACGITARLTTCDLKSSLSNFTDLRQGGEQKQDAARIQRVLSKAEKLSERPIGADGSESGVLQFVGARQDLPLFMVECSEQLRQKRLEIHCDFDEDEPAPGGVADSSDSPLTSLGATPTSGRKSFDDTDFQLDPLLSGGPTTQPTSKPQYRSRRKKKAYSKPLVEDNTLEQALRGADRLYESGERALVLDIQLENDSFLPSRGGSASLGKDLKVEVFINGQLAEVDFINARRSAARIVGGHIRYAGTRLHRQTEKPWMYAPDDVPSQIDEAEQQWHAVTTGLAHEVRRRGTDRFGDRQPSAEYLGALAATQLPERLRSTSAVGVVDLVITAGKGQKYGPDTAYLTVPTRLGDEEFTSANPAVDPILLSNQEPVDLFSGGAVLSPFKAMGLKDAQPLESSPDIPLRSQVRAHSVSTSPSPTKKAMSLAKEFGLSITREQGKLMTVGAFQNQRGKAGPEKRTLFQRLSDLKKMTEANRTRELAALKVEFSEVFAAECDVGQAKEDERPTKRARTNSSANYIDPSNMMIDPSLGDTDHKLQEDDVFGPTDPEAVLAQNRIDMALDSGAASDGPLLRRIASMSPVKAPRKTTASALAYSPTRVPIKEQRQGQKPQTPQKRSENDASLFEDGFQLPQTPKARGTSASPTKTGRGSNRTATRWMPGEAPFTEALAAFEVPEECKGSCVTYPEGKEAMRQINKARGGTFKEETLVVGMRFVVW